jgi:hypothetical protein
MKKQVYHEGYNYVLEYDNNSLIMYKEDTDEWMGDIEYIKVFTVEGNTPKPIVLYRKLVVAANKLITQANKNWFMFNVTDQKRADIYERFTRSIKGYSCQRADNYFYLYRDNYQHFRSLDLTHDPSATHDILYNLALRFERVSSIWVRDYALIDGRVRELQCNPRYGVEP